MSELQTWWLVWKHDGIPKPVKVVSATAKSLIVRSESLFDNSVRESRERKDTEYQKYFKTKLEAITHIVQRETDAANRLRGELAITEEKLAKATEQLKAEQAVTGEQ